MRSSSVIKEPTLEHVPTALQLLDQWVNWAGVWSEDKKKFSKPPMTASGRNASSTDEATWSTYHKSLEALGRDGIYTDNTGKKHHVTLDGVGLAGLERTPYTGIDLDHCIDRETGEITRYAMKIVREFNSYTEITPSLNGLRIWIEAEKPPGTWSASKNAVRELEVYDRGRFFTVTGLHLGDTPKTIEGRQDVLDAFMKREAPSRREQPKLVQRTLRKPYTGSGEHVRELEDYFKDFGVTILRQINDATSARAYYIVCPWVHEHTGGDDSGTRAGQYPSGAPWFQCDHGHCDGRRWEHFRDHFEPGCYEPWWVKVVAKNG